MSRLLRCWPHAGAGNDSFKGLRVATHAAFPPSVQPDPVRRSRAAGSKSACRSRRLDRPDSFRAPGFQIMEKFAARLNAAAQGPLDPSVVYLVPRPRPRRAINARPARPTRPALRHSSSPPDARSPARPARRPRPPIRSRDGRTAPLDTTLHPPGRLSSRRPPNPRPALGESPRGRPSPPAPAPPGPPMPLLPRLPNSLVHPSP